MVTIALTHVPQEGPLLQHLVSLVAPSCVDQWQSDRVGRRFLHQSQLLMSAHFEKKNSSQGAHLIKHIHAHHRARVCTPIGHYFD